jgi:hypothetical protein
MMHPVNRPGSKEEFDRIIQDTKEITPPGIIPIVPIHMSDGPIAIENLEKFIIGKVVGVYQASNVAVGRLS